MSAADVSGDMELERRFIVHDRGILRGTPEAIGQAYLFANDGWCVRVRRTFHYESGLTVEAPSQLTVKGPRHDAARPEKEWTLEPHLAVPLFKASQWKVFKSRYQLVDAGTTWDVDEFYFDNAGLIIAECEMKDCEALTRLAPPLGVYQK